MGWIVPIDINLNSQCGVYLITFSDNTMYVGSSIHLRKRILKWFNSNKKECFENALLNPLAFKFEVLEYVSEEITRNEIHLIERKWQDNLDVLNIKNCYRNAKKENNGYGCVLNEAASKNISNAQKLTHLKRTAEDKNIKRLKLSKTHLSKTVEEKELTNIKRSESMKLSHKNRKLNN